MPESLAVRKAAMPAAITRVHEVLDAFVARDHDGEILTAVRHFPAREAQWADFPAWVHADLSAAYAAKGFAACTPIKPPQRKQSTPGKMSSSSRRPPPEKRFATTCPF